jgi:predicted nucleic acid-binding protein
VILLDTSVLIDSLTGPRRSARALRHAIAGGARVVLSTIVLYEWLRGPRLPGELAAQEALFPRESAIPFGTAEAARAADIYRALRTPRGREVDVAIAACAICWDAQLWTHNTGDFTDMAGLDLYPKQGSA